MEFGEHLLKTLAVRRQGAVEVIYHPPLQVSDFADRKVLAARAEDMVRSGLVAHLPAAAAIASEAEGRPDGDL